MSDLILVFMTALLVLSVIVCVSIFTLKAEVELIKETLEEELTINNERYAELEKRIARVEVIIDGKTD